MSWHDVPAGAWPAQAAATPEPGQLAVGTAHTIATPPAAARQHLLRALREISFELRTERFSLLEATRGSKLGGVTLTPSRVPVELRITLDENGTGARVTVLLRDRWPGRVGRNWGATAAYSAVFDEVRAMVDAVLRRLDPAAGPASWWRDLGTGDVGVMRNAASLAGRASDLITRQAARILDGDQPERRQAAVEGTGAEQFVFAAPESVAEVPAEIVDGMLTAGTLIASRPGAMPPHLVTQVQSLVLRVEEYLAATTGPARFRMPVEAADVPVVTFLHQQAVLRGRLPLRTLRTCTTCRLETIANPDLERLRERGRRTQQLASSIGAVVTPYVLAGRLMQLSNKSPEFACPRCQGMDADETIATYCQRCGDRRTETALRTCPKCQFDFRTLAPPTTLWHASPPPAELAATPAPAAPAPAAVPAAPSPPASAASPPASAPPASPGAVDADDPATWPRPPGT